MWCGRTLLLSVFPEFPELKFWKSGLKQAEDSPVWIQDIPRQLSECERGVKLSS